MTRRIKRVAVLGAGTMGVAIADSSAVGYYFLPQVSSRSREVARKSCGVFTPDRRRHRFAFAYDPAGNGGVGRVTVTLDDHEEGFDLTPEQRRAGATFDRFGLANVRSGGHSVEFYLDDDPPIAATQGDLVYAAERVVHGINAGLDGVRFLAGVGPNEDAPDEQVDVVQPSNPR